MTFHKSPKNCIIAEKQWNSTKLDNCFRQLAETFKSMSAIISGNELAMLLPIDS